jgi:hypothetical protein
MAATVLDGKAMAAMLRAEAQRDAKELIAKGITPGLAVALVGEDPASAVYVRNKVKACEELGIVSTMQTLPATTSETELLALIDRWNADPSIDGILVQLPVPKQIRTNALIDRIDPAKDVDGFHPHNLGLLAAGRAGLVACTPAGVMKMLAIYGKAYGAGSLNYGWQADGDAADQCRRHRDHLPLAYARPRRSCRPGRSADRGGGAAALGARRLDQARGGGDRCGHPPWRRRQADRRRRL